MPYFDHNATTQLLPAAREAWLDASAGAWSNPSSPYRASARVHRLLEEARERVAQIIDCPASEIVFTSGATEANNAVIAWAARTFPTDAMFVVSRTEHPSVIESARACIGGRVRWLAVDQRGVPILDEARSSLRAGIRGLIAVMAANNETGVLAPLPEIDELSRERQVSFLCDASQWIGRLSARELPRSAFLVGCAHKFGGPKGVGFLRVPPDAGNFHGAYGGSQESDRRGGTENFPAIAAMVAALECAEAGSESERASRAAWRDAFVADVARAIPGVTVNGASAPRLWNSVSLCLPAQENTRWVARLDKLGFEVSTGSACASGSSSPSHVLAAMGRAPDQARRTIRVSAGWETTQQDWRDLAAAMSNVWQQFQCEDTGDGGSSVARV